MNINILYDFQLYKSLKDNTPRLYPYGSPESAGQAHIRLHEATRKEGIRLRGGNPEMSDTDLMNHYTNAYNNPSLIARII